MDGFFLFKVDGYGVLFDQRQPAVGFDQQAMRFDDFAVYLEGSVVKFGIIVNGGILVIVLRDFYPAGGIPGLLDDDRVVRRAGGVVVEDDGVRQAG
jgi:hypothetical protein